MASRLPFHKQHPIFNYDRSPAGGVLFPFMLKTTTVSDAIDFNGADTSTILASFVAPYDCVLITVQAYACADGVGLKAGASTVEPVIGVVYGTNQLVTAAAGTSLNLITCSGAGAAGKIWSGVGTTQTEISEGQEVAAYLKTAAADAEDTTLQDGAAKVVVWIACVNSPVGTGVR